MTGIFDIIKEEFCGLTTYKLRGKTIEIVTPFSTLRNKFVSILLGNLKINLSYQMEDGLI